MQIKAAFGGRFCHDLLAMPHQHRGGDGALISAV